MTAAALVVVPSYNEEAAIGDVVLAVLAAGFDCLVIDDASRDASARRAAEAGAVVVRLPINLGVGGALRTGWRYAVDHGYDVAVQVDGDGQHPADEIAALVAAVADGGADIAVGSRFADGGSYVSVSRVRRSAMRLLATVLRRSAGVRVTDPTSGFRAIRGQLLSEFARNFPPNYLGDTFEALLVAGRRGYRVREVGVTMRERQGGTPSAAAWGSIKAMIRAVSLLVLGPSFDIAPRQD